MIHMNDTLHTLHEWIHLQDATLDPQAPSTCRAWMRRLLLTPPPFQQAVHLHKAVAAILVCQQVSLVHCCVHN
jgi:hypothetical protein